MIRVARFFWTVLRQSPGSAVMAVMYAPHMSLHHISTTEVLSTSVAVILLTLQIQLIIHTTSLHISVQLYKVCILPSLSYRSHFKTITVTFLKGLLLPITPIHSETLSTVLAEISLKRGNLALQCIAGL